jgi:hypothetical protein
MRAPTRLRAGGFVAPLVLMAMLGWAPAASAATPATTARAASPRGGALVDRGAVLAARRFLCPHGGSPMRGGRCRGGAGRGGVALAADATDPAVLGWDAGLPAVTHRQSPCPSGTVQAPVLFWTDALRCVPQ